jgi:glycosyltransferase involved in cell wall biosynthesis
MQEPRGRKELKETRMVSPPHPLVRTKPKASIMVITYNHEKYIAQALESVLMQETEYSYEINVIEDCSTDRTQEIILRYKERFPDKINIYFNPKNIGTLSPPAQKVFYEGFKTLRGDYLAILEGDDYWTSPQKLQQQISFLEGHRDFVACAHNTLKIYEDGSQAPHRFHYVEGNKHVHTVHDFAAMTSFFHASSILYRNVLRGVPVRAFRSKWSCDIFLTLAHVQYGKLRNFDEDMSVYRSHKGGNYSNLPETKGRIFNIEGIRRYNRWLSYKYLKDFSFTIYRLCLSLIKHAQEGKIAPLTRAERLKYRMVAAFYGKIYDVLDRYPKLDPAVFWYKESAKSPCPKLERIAGFLR